MTKQRMTLISLVGILVFSILLSGQIIYQHNWVDAKILNQSRQINGIESAKVMRVNDMQYLEVMTGHVADLPRVTQDILKLSSGKAILLRDNRNGHLQLVFNKMQFALQEAIARGNFSEMAQNIEQKASLADVNLSLSMDSDYIYLTLDEEQSQLVAVLERHNQGRFLPSESK